MAPARGRGGRGSRTGTILVLAGIAGVLTTTFITGVWTGRHWPLLTGDAKPAAPAEPTTGRRGTGDRPKQAEPLPALTFYHELTAPLTAPPPPPKPARSARPPEPRREHEKVDGASAPPGPSLPPPAGQSEMAAPSPGGQYTVQVGAYNARTPAEALRTTLAAAGHDVRVAEAETPGGVRYRVQVGAFPTREAARETAARLARERSLPAFVTPR
jgi:cell division protein FtsN